MSNEIPDMRDASGALALGNAGYGVYILNGASTLVGGAGNDPVIGSQVRNLMTAGFGLGHLVDHSSSAVTQATDT